MKARSFTAGASFASYVRHEIVHNRTVVEDLKAKGAIFVEELNEIPDTTAPVIFSAHGVAKAVQSEAKRRNFFYLDATCPLVSKVHVEAQRRHEEGREISSSVMPGIPKWSARWGSSPRAS